MSNEEEIHRARQHAAALSADHRRGRMAATRPIRRARLGARGVLVLLRPAGDIECLPNVGGRVCGYQQIMSRLPIKLVRALWLLMWVSAAFIFGMDMIIGSSNATSWMALLGGLGFYHHWYETGRMK